MSSPQRRLASVVVVALVGLAACSSDDSPDIASDGQIPLPTDVAVADDVIIATEDGQLPTQSTVPDSIPAVDLPPEETIAPGTVPGEGESSESGEPATGTPIVTTIPPTVPVTAPAPDETPRIVSLSPSHTEMLFAMGAGDLVVAVAAENNFVADASGVEELSLELGNSLLGDAVAAFDPTLVIVGGDEPITAETVSAADLPLYLGQPASTLDEIARQVADLGELTGRDTEAAALNQQMQDSVSVILDDLGPLTDAGLTFFHEVDPTLVTFDDSIFLVGLFGELGLTNAYVSTGSPRLPQMTFDELAAADPDVITLGDIECCRVTVGSVAERPGWSDLTAVQNGAVVPLTDAQYQGWGPGVIDVLRLVADALTS